MAKSKKTNAELQAELKLLKSQRRADTFATAINKLITWGGIVLCFRYAYFMIASLAGKTTFADVAVNVLGKIGISTSLAWFLAASCGVYGFSQRRLRKNTVERLQGRIVEFEKAKDASRSSSNLTPRGDTRAEDD